MRPQDILILLQLITLQGKKWTQNDLAKALKISQSEVAESLMRLKRAKLLNDETKEPVRTSLYEFLIYGIQYVFPAEPGTIVRGLPTSHSAPCFKGKIVAGNEDKYVWPYSHGKDRGIAIEPLYVTVPEIAENNPGLYVLLSLIDAIRIGKTREREIAKQELEKIILKVKK